MRTVWPCLAVAACVHQQVAVHPVELAHASAELHARGETTVLAMQGIDPELHTLAMRDTVAVPSGEVTVRELMEDCPPTAFAIDDATRAAYPHCKLIAVAPHHVILSDHLRPSTAAKAVLAGVVIGGVIGCAIECPKPVNYIAGGSLALAGTAGLVGLVALMWIAVTMQRD